MTAERDQIARLIDHAALHPAHSAADTRAACAVAARQRVAAACVKPCYVQTAVEALRGSPVAVCAVIGFPHGNSATAIKLEEARLALDQGAREIDSVVNLGALKSGDWPAVQRELERLQSLVSAHDAVFKLIFECGLLADDEVRRLARLCAEIPLDFVKTSTGFATARDAGSGGLRALGATSDAVRMMADEVGGRCRIKASGGIRTLADVLEFRALGCARIGTSSTEAILDECADR